MAIIGALGAFYAQTDDAAATFTDEATTNSGARYAIADATKRYWDEATPPTVKVDGVTVSSGYSVEYVGGVVVFDEDPADTVTVSGKCLTVEQVGGCFNWSLEVSNDMEATPEFGDVWKNFTPLQNGWTGSAERYWGDEKFFDALGTKMIGVFYVDTDSDLRYEGYVVVSNDGIETPHDGIINETIDFQGSEQLRYRA